MLSHTQAVIQNLRLEFFFTNTLFDSNKKKLTNGNTLNIMF